MITFYEGLPRSGKSYSALKDEIIPRLQAGRKVFAYVEGLNHEAIAVASAMPLDRVRDLLVQINREQVPTIWEHVQNDALVVIDEAQNFWSGGKLKLGAEITEFVAEHGHRGLDIVLMGQSIKDIHPLWRRRVERKIYFQKKTALGMPNSFSATFHVSVPKGDDVQFKPTQTVNYAYDSKYFGTYASHTADTSNKSTHVDSRAVIWNSPLFRRWLPIFGVVLCFAGYYVWGFFHGGLESSITKKAPVGSEKGALVGSPVPTPGGTAVAGPGGVVPGVPYVADKVPDVVEQLGARGRIRFLGFMRASNNIEGWVEWRDGANNVLQVMSIRELAGLGYMAMVNDRGTMATFTRGPVIITALAWPIEAARGVASEAEIERSRGVANGQAPKLIVDRAS